MVPRTSNQNDELLVRLHSMMGSTNLTKNYYSSTCCLDKENKDDKGVWGEEFNS